VREVVRRRVCELKKNIMKYHRMKVWSARIPMLATARYIGSCEGVTAIAVLMPHLIDAGPEDLRVVVAGWETPGSVSVPTRIGEHSLVGKHALRVVPNA